MRISNCGLSGRPCALPLTSREAQNVRASGPQIAPEELARLKVTESEVMRLRNQVGLLRKRIGAEQCAKGAETGAQEAMEALTPAVTNEVVGAL